jgi:hypothetical protein
MRAEVLGFTELVNRLGTMDQSAIAGEIPAERARTRGRRAVVPRSELTVRTRSGMNGRGRLGGSAGRELSAIRNVARSTATRTPHRGHFGVIVLPVTPSRNESAPSQCGQGPNLPVAMNPPTGRSLKK